MEVMDGGYHTNAFTTILKVQHLPSKLGGCYWFTSLYLSLH